MLGASRCFQKFSVSLHPLDISGRKSRSQKRILSERFLSASPARIAENVDIRRPKSKSLVDVVIFMLVVLVEFYSCFGGDHIGNCVNPCRIKGCGKRDCVWEYRCRAASCYAMGAFIPPVVCMNSQSFDGGRIVQELGDFFLNGHFCNELFCALVCPCPVHFCFLRSLYFL